MTIQGMGVFEYYKDKHGEYWKIEQPTLSLPKEFDFGALQGTSEGTSTNAQVAFEYYASNPGQLFGFLDQRFESVASKHIDAFKLDAVEKEFLVKSLAVNDKENFECGFHSRSKDLLIEIFVRNGAMSELYSDEGCCEV